MPTQADIVTGRIANTGVRWWTFSLYSGLALAVGVSLLALSLCTCADALWHLPRALLGLLFTLWSALTLGLLGVLLARLLKSQRSLAATARRIELEFPDLGSHLINLVPLSQGGDHPPDPFRQAAAEQAAAAARTFPLEAAGAAQPRWRRFLLCMQTPRDLLESSLLLAAALGLAFVLYLLVPNWSTSTRRLFHPWTFVPAIGSVKIVKVTPGDTDLLVGSALEIRAQIENPSQRAYAGALFVRRNGTAETSLRLQPDGGRRTYVASIPQVQGPLEYRVEIGDSQSEEFTVRVSERPAIDGVDVTYEYPGYIGWPAETRKQTHGDLEAPQGTHALLRVHARAPIARGHLLVDGRKVYGRLAGDGRTLEAEVWLVQETSYTIHLFTDAGHTDPDPRTNRVHVLPDAPPSLELVEPSTEADAAAGAILPVIASAADDYGLGQVRVEVQTAAPGAPAPVVQTIASWTEFPEPKRASLHHQLKLDPARFKPGQTVRVRAVARDRRAIDIPRVRLEPQETSTPWHQVRVLDRSAQASAEMAELDTVRAALLKLLQQQVQARAGTAEVSRESVFAQASARAGQVRLQQVEIQRSAAALVQGMTSGSDDETRRAIKRALNKLAFGEMLAAVSQAEALAKAETPARCTLLTEPLKSTQDRIIDILRRLLAAAHDDVGKLLAEMKQRPDTQLPADAENRLRALKEKLEAFLKQQKKVIEATENLAKQPVDDFTEKEKDLLRGLAATEEDWSRFMAEQQSDLSKLPEQDFSNPSLLKELVDVQTELQMAKDALTKKTAEIAVPLEQLGAEMAEALTTNIEKWLPDTPDRERWSQEEPLADDMKEAPMAELPKELDDLVGDLMEEEEDLFDEMEDASSSWADSLDKGAGWDAMDGPISNMSARGVTGNRLPNSSEISGRSGEGRQGRASGEFVADTAVGKGGRKTPSRLTPDPYVKGKVNDQSKDPVGGATGGGKQSGQGGEGLHGPVPNRPGPLLGRLADKQAQLRNKAEGVDLRFNVVHYQHADLKKLIDQMAAVERDLRAGRYQNALRRRAVLLDGLGQVKTFLDGEFRLKQDATANLPTEIQKEILGSMQEASPAGWDELNRQYFERLAAPADASAKPPPTSPPAGTRVRAGASPLGAR